MVQVTIETTGTMLVGTDIAAATTIVDALGVPVMGLNCATGPKEMAEHVRHLSQSWRGLISCLPNAGLPELRCGHTHYPLGPDELARLDRALHRRGRHQHRRRLLRHRGRAHRRARRHAAPDRRGRLPARGSKPRQPQHTPSLASLFSAVPLRQENAFLAIGERCNANGSKKFRELQAAGDWDGCVAMGREQVREGSNALDVCTAFVGRDEVAEMTAVVERMRGQVDSPLVIDSTELPVLEAALELYGGKAVLNSINFEDGEAPATARMTLARKFGAAVIALTIDEAGMAKTREDKLRITRRLVEFACGRFGLPQSGPADRPADLHDLHRQRGRPQAGLVDAGGDRGHPRRVPRAADHPGPLQRLLRPQPRRPARAQLGHARPRHAARPHRGHRPRQQDRAAAQDPARGGRGRRGPDLRPPPRRLRPAAGVHGAVRRPQGRGRRRQGAARDRRGAAEAAHRRRRQAGPRGRSRRRRCSATRRSRSSTTSCSTA